MRDEKNISCRKFEEELPDYISGRLNPVVSAQMSAHSQMCAKCAQAEQKENLRLRRSGYVFTEELHQVKRGGPATGTAKLNESQQQHNCGRCHHE